MRHPPPPREDCDLGACTAEAMVFADYTSGQLAFCGHHWDEVAPTASLRVLRVADRRRAPELPLSWLPELLVTDSVS